MYKKIFLTLILTLTLSNLVKAQQNTLVDGIVGVVGDKIILFSDVEVQIQQAKLQGVTGDITCQVVDQLMLEKLLVNQAERDSIFVTEDEVLTEVEKRLRYYIGLVGSEARFEEYYGKTPLQFKEEFKPEIEKILQAQRMQGEIVNTITVTPAEVKTFFAQIPQDSLPYYNAEVEIAQIMIQPVVTKEAKETAKNQLRDLRKRIVDGSNTFEELATAYSADPGSAAQGGVLGFQARGTFVKEFEAAAYKLKKGEISGIVETEYGFHLMKLIERRGNEINIQHILIQAKISSNDLQIAKTKADSIRQLIVEDSLAFEEAVKEFSDDANSIEMEGLMVNYNTGSSFFEMDQLSPDIFFAVEALDAGEVSEPVEVTNPDGSKVYFLFKVLTRTSPHKANLNDDYDRIQEITKSQKQQSAMSEWVTEKVGETYIFLVPRYQECSSLVKWVN